MAMYTSDKSVITENPEASGLSAVHEGFGWTAEDDRLFALGFPLVRWLATAHPDDANVDAAVTMAAEKAYPGYAMEWPARIAARLLRKWGVPRHVAASTSEEPLSEDEAKLFAARFSRGAAGGAYDQHEDAALLLEAFVGAEAALEHLTAGFEAISAKDWPNITHNVQAVAVAMGVMLDRVSPTRGKATRKRLADLLKKREKSHPAMAGTKALDVLLNGAEGFKRSGNKLGTGEPIARFAALAGDDRAAVQQVVVADAKPSTARHIARLAYLGGADQVLPEYARKWNNIKSGDEQQRLIETVGRIRSPHTVEMMLDMSTASKAKKAAAQWFADRAAAVRPFLEATKGQHKTAADAILKKLGKQ